MPKAKDLTGKKFGRLTALEYSGDGKWLCKCDCGNNKIVRSSHLTSGHTKSCGCYKSDLARKRADAIRKHGDTPNNYEIDGCICYCFVYNSKYPVLLDSDCYELVRKYRWHINNNGYVYCNKNGGNTTMHRLIMGSPSKMYEVDHINGDKIDNRKCNLRIVNRQQNSMNKKPNKLNKSGYSGVWWNEKRCVWESCITVDYKIIHLGRYKIKEDAIKARKEAEEKYFGEYAHCVK